MTNGRRQLCVTEEAKKLELATEKTTVAGESPEIKGLILQHAVWMQKEAYAESTISRRIRLLRTLANKGGAKLVS